MQNNLKKEIIRKRDEPKKATTQTGLFQSVMTLVLQAKSPAQIKASFPNTMPQIIATYVAACKATIACDSCYAIVAPMKGAK